MKKYFNQIILLECICIVYTIIHNYYYTSQYGMFAAVFLIMACSLFLFWHCFANKVISKTQKLIGLFFASIPLLSIIGFGIWMLLFIKAIH